MAKTNVSERMKSRFTKTAELKGQHDLIEDLRRQIEDLKQNQPLAPSQSSRKFLVDIKNIRPSNQSRQTFTQKMIAERMESLRTQGQLSPLVLFPLEGEITNNYAIEDGELTWRAASALVEQGEDDWQELTASLSNAKSESELHFRSLLHHLHKETLNTLDRIDSVMMEIEDKCQIDSDTAFKALNNIAYKIKKNPQLGEIIEQSTKSEVLRENETVLREFSQEQVSILTLLSLLQIDFKSFIKTDLAFYPVPEDLKVAVRMKEMPCSHILPLSKLKQKYLPNKAECEIRSIRDKAVEKVLEEKLSFIQTKSLVKNILLEHSGKKTEKSSVKQLKKIQKQIDGLKLQDFSQDELMALKDTVKVCLTEIEQMLS